MPQHQLTVQNAPVHREPPSEQSVHHRVPARAKVKVVPGEVVKRTCVHPVNLDALTVELVLDNKLTQTHVLPRLVAVAFLSGVHRSDQRTGLQVLPLERHGLGVQRLAHSP